MEWEEGVGVCFSEDIFFDKCDFFSPLLTVISSSRPIFSQMKKE